jgi:ribosomal-protein-alanine N-acetyltransferase
MVWEDVPEVMQIDQRSFTLPWSMQTYRHEVCLNNTSHYYVLRHQPAASRRAKSFLKRLSRRKEGAPIVAYGGFWLIADEAHISTIAVDAHWRGRGLGEFMLMAMIEQAMALQTVRVTLEVRENNIVAQNLYRKYGFVVTGKRSRYYRDNNEDALLMLVEEINSEAYRLGFRELSANVLRRLSASGLLALHGLYAGQSV